MTFTFDSPTQLTSSDFLKEFKFIAGDGKPHASSQKNFQGSFKSGGEHRLTIATLPSEQPLTLKWGSTRRSTGSASRSSTQGRSTGNSALPLTPS